MPSDAPADVDVAELPFGITWTVREPMRRSSHALVDDGRVWLVDPVFDEAVLDRVAALGAPAGVVQLLDRHDRDGAEIAARLGVPLRRLPDTVPDAPFRVVRVLDRPGWHERALWLPAHDALVVSETLGTAPLFAVGAARVGVHPLLRLFPPRSPFRAFAPRHLLVGHGAGLHDGDVAEDVRSALDRSRTDIPKLLAALPGALRHGG